MKKGKKSVFKFDSLSVNLEDLHNLQRGGEKTCDFLVVGSVEGNDPLAGMCTELSNVFSNSNTHFPWSTDALDSSHGQCCLSMVRCSLLSSS